MREIGIAITQKVDDDSRLTEVIGKGDYDIFAWGWTPFVDPDPMLSYFTCDQVADDPENPTDYYNDANWCDPEYDQLYEQQKVELDRREARRPRARDAHPLPASGASTTCSTPSPTCRRTGRAASRASSSSRRRPAR